MNAALWTPMHWAWVCAALAVLGPLLQWAWNAMASPLLADIFHWYDIDPDEQVPPLFWLKYAVVLFIAVWALFFGHFALQEQP